MLPWALPRVTWQQQIRERCLGCVMEAHCQDPSEAHDSVMSTLTGLERNSIQRRMECRNRILTLMALGHIRTCEACSRIHAEISTGSWKGLTSDSFPTLFMSLWDTSQKE